MDSADSNREVTVMTPKVVGKNKLSKSGKVNKKNQTSSMKQKSLGKKSGTSNCRIIKNKARGIENKRILRSSIRGIRTSSRIRNNEAEHIRNQLLKNKCHRAKHSSKGGSSSRKTKIPRRIKRNSAIHRQMSGTNAEGSERRAARKALVVSNKKCRRKTTVAQSSRCQRRRECDAGTSEQRETQNSFRRNETMTSERTEEREPSTAETLNMEAMAIESTDDRESVSSNRMPIDLRMAQQEFVREMELEIREIGRLVETMGTDFIREISELEREVERHHRETTRGFHSVLQDARRIMEHRITEITNQMILNINTSTANRLDRSGSEIGLWSLATSVLRDTRQSEELGTWIADIILGVSSGGLTEADINRLPTWNYSSAASRKASMTVGSNRSVSRKCQICLSFYEGGNLIRTLPCFHDFHATCVDKWLKLRRTCPTCRYEISF